MKVSWDFLFNPKMHVDDSNKTIVLMPDIAMEAFSFFISYLKIQMEFFNPV